MKNKLILIGNRLKNYWFVGVCGYLVLAHWIATLAVIGLATAQEKIPHAFDNTWFNFDFLWVMISVFIYCQFAIMGLTLYFVFRKLFKKREVKQ